LFVAGRVRRRRGCCWHVNLKVVVSEPSLGFATQKCCCKSDPHRKHQIHDFANSCRFMLRALRQHRVPESNSSSQQSSVWCCVCCRRVLPKVGPMVCKLVVSGPSCEQTRCHTHIEFAKADISCCIRIVSIMLWASDIMFCLLPAGSAEGGVAAGM
jgi:hypothetical protein